jgi:hypothetical protein
MDDQVKISIVGDASGAIGALKEVSSSTKDLSRSLKDVGGSGEEAAKKIKAGMEQANYSIVEARHGAMMLGEELGIKIPRALAGVAARSETIGPLLEKAFGALAVVGFIDLAKQAGEAISEMASKTFVFTDAMRSMQSAIVADNLETVALQEHMKEVSREMELLGKSPVQAAQIKVGWKAEDLGNIATQMAQVQAAMDRLKASGDKDESLFQEMQQGWKEMGFDTGAMTTAEAAMAQLQSKMGVLQTRQKAALADFTLASEKASEEQAKAAEEYQKRAEAAYKKVRAELDRLYDEEQKAGEELQKANQSFANVGEKDVFKSVTESDDELNAKLKLSSERLHMLLELLKAAQKGEKIDVPIAADNAAEAGIIAQIKAVQSLQATLNSLKSGITSVNNVFTDATANWIVKGESFSKSFAKGFQQMELQAVKSLARVTLSMSEGLAKALIMDDQKKLSSAKLAASNTYASVSSIPVVGWVLAPVAAGAAFAEAMAFSAGGIVPDVGPDGDVNLALLRRNEMILPPSISQSVQDMAANGGGSGGAGDIHVHAMDSKSFTDFLKRNPSALGAGIHNAARGGHINAAQLARGK